MSKRTIKEIEIVINDRPTIIRYAPEIDLEKFIEYYELYKKRNSFNKPKILAIDYTKGNFKIIDKEFYDFKKEEKSCFYSDDQVYIDRRNFKPKSRIELKKEKIFKNRKKEREERE